MPPGISWSELFEPHSASTNSVMDVVGVPRIIEDTLPSHFQADLDPDWEPYAAYVQTARININVRQVFPKGFN
jgi:hypothetical protein